MLTLYLKEQGEGRTLTLIDLPIHTYQMKNLGGSGEMPQWVKVSVTKSNDSTSPVQSLDPKVGGPASLQAALTNTHAQQHA